MKHHNSNRLRNNPRLDLPVLGGFPQTHMRQIQWFLQRCLIRTLQLQRQLVEIEHSRKCALARIQWRKERKIVKFHRKCARKESEREQEYEKVSGIIEYLKRDMSRLQRENEKYRVCCEDLKRESRRLLVLLDRSSWSSRKHDVDRLQAENDSLQVKLHAYKEAILRVEEWRRMHSQDHSQEAMVASKNFVNSSLSPMERSRGGSTIVGPVNSCASPCYASQIAINCDNEAEANCYHYRLVQDVYTLAPSNRVSTSHSTA